MAHGIGVTEALRSVPDAVVLLFALVTQLGDLWFYFLALTVAYAFGESLVGDAVSRERIAAVVAVAVGALAVTAGLKELFAHPRPPGAGTLRPMPWLPAVLVPVVESFATADGYALPSGHATGSAAVYGAAALFVRYGRARARYLLAAVAVLLVALSRVVIGVHYLLDVVVGVVAGLTYLAVVHRATGGGQRVKRAFTLAVLAGAAAAAIHFSVETLAALGGALGGRIGWTVFGERATTGAVTRREGAVALAVAVPVGGALIGVGATTPSPVVGFLGTGLALATVLGAPLAARQVLGKDPV
ncbi:phosphatase PAP2 family protein [Halorarius halobius]|uniref:phosphatase PAP2 family protein n=1 Tax=Halorarius halobius TaxID=2962671 RepID=UPI0020CE21A0|nr:phosphatase PAP2 family protein [Halorarius halobius]